MIMIPHPIFLFFRKYADQNWFRFDLKINQFFKTGFAFLFDGIHLVVFLFISILSSAQNLELKYNVRFNDQDIGWLRLEKNISGDKLNLLLTSEIKTQI